MTQIYQHPNILLVFSSFSTSSFLSSIFSVCRWSFTQLWFNSCHFYLYGRFEKNKGWRSGEDQSSCHILHCDLLEASRISLQISMGVFSVGFEINKWKKEFSWRNLSNFILLSSTWSRFNWSESSEDTSFVHVSLLIFFTSSTSNII